MFTVKSLFNKKTLLAMAVFVSASAFAETCPDVDKINIDPDTSHWVTDNGWTSLGMASGDKAATFAYARFITPHPSLSEVGALESCNYYAYDKNNKQFLIKLIYIKKTNWAKIEESTQKNWVKLQTERGNNYECPAKSSQSVSVSDCQFNFEENQSRKSPF